MWRAGGCKLRILDLQMKRLQAGFLFLSIAASTAGYATTIVEDGGFEVPDTNNYTGSLGDGWTATRGTVQVGADTPGYDYASPHSGFQYVYLDFYTTTNTVAQTLATTPGQSYNITFWLADEGPDPITVDFGSQVLLNGSAPTNGVSSPSDYVEYSYLATATSASTVISFTSTWADLPDGFGVLLDDVSVTAATTAPEPSGWLLAGPALLAIAVLRRRPGAARH